MNIKKYLKETLTRYDRDEFILSFEKMIGDKDIVISYENGKITVRTKNKNTFIHHIKGSIEDMITITIMLNNRDRFDVSVKYTGIPERKIRKLKKQFKKYGIR